MESISEAMAAAVAHHQSDRLGEAEQIYRQVLAADPNHGQAWHLLGVVCAQRGENQSAIEYIGRAIGIDAAVAAFHSNLGNVYQALAQHAAAAACYREALALAPTRAQAHYDLGLALQQQGKAEEAIVCYRRTLELQPEHPAAHTNLAIALQSLGQLQEAISQFEQAVALQSDVAETHFNLGVALAEQGDPDAAIVCYRRTLALRPDHAEAHNNLGVCLQELDQWDAAMVHYQRAVDLQADFAKAHFNLGNVHKERGSLDEAAACYRRAIQLQDNFPEAHTHLGTIHKEQGESDQAIACYRRAVELRPDHAVAQSMLVYELQRICQWDGLFEISRQVIEAVENGAKDVRTHPVLPFCFLVLPIPTTAAQQLRCAQQWVARQAVSIASPTVAPPAQRVRRSKSKLTVGYLSADFRAHATAQLIVELFEKHDRERFNVFGYSYGHDDGGPLRARIARSFDRFVDVKTDSASRTAEGIAADDVDILVDLKGHTADARMQILARRPAPVQVNYLGYPGTMGAAFIDYILVDDFIVPSDQQPFFSERLVHLPGCYQVNDSQRAIDPRVPSREECDLPAEGFVFCSFNHNYKITPPMFDVWMNLLAVVPGSVLWLLESNRFARANLRREAEARGIAGERLVFAPRLPLAEHLARYRLADLFLDTFPVNSHTTASDALWAGCPLVTIAGETFVSRVAGSLLQTLGLHELIATGLAEYERLALRLARDPRSLAELRARLQKHATTSMLFDAGQHARNLEAAYATMWDIHISGKRPTAFRVRPL